MTEYLSYRNQYTAEQTNGLVSILIGTSIMKKLNKKTGFLKSFFYVENMTAIYSWFISIELV